MTNPIKALEDILYCQSQTNMLPSAVDFLEDFAAKAIVMKAVTKQAGQRPFSDEAILSHLGEYYRQVREVCLAKLVRGKEIAKNFFKTNTYNGDIIPESFLA